jgi:hypothetical protein
MSVNTKVSCCFLTKPDNTGFHESSYEFFFRKSLFPAICNFCGENSNGYVIARRNEANSLLFLVAFCSVECSTKWKGEQPFAHFEPFTSFNSFKHIRNIEKYKHLRE